MKRSIENQPSFKFQDEPTPAVVLKKIKEKKEEVGSELEIEKESRDSFKKIYRHLSEEDRKKMRTMNGSERRKIIAKYSNLLKKEEPLD